MREFLYLKCVLDVVGICWIFLVVNLVKCREGDILFETDVTNKCVSKWMENATLHTPVPPVEWVVQRWHWQCLIKFVSY